MATTCKLIAKTTLVSNSASITFGSGGTIPQSFTDLLIVFSARSSRSQPEDGLGVKINSETSGYTYRVLSGNGATVSSINTAFEATWATRIVGNSATSSTFGNGSIYFPNYAGSTSKSYSAESVTENNGTTAFITASAINQSSTSATTEITLSALNGNLVSGSSFYLYGITRAADVPGTFGIQATGGDVTISGGYKYHVFKSSGTFNVTSPGWAEVLVVGGGGAGGSGYGGGGGAGGLITSNYLLENNQYLVIIGAGGGSVSSGAGTSGNNSSLGKLTALAGGGGGGWDTAIPGVNGGSGGGAAPGLTTGSIGSPAGTSIQTSGFGNSGGTGYRGSGTLVGGGGGGAGSVGQSAPQTTNRNGSAGGDGVVWPSNSNSYYAGGGGGCASSNGNIGLGGSGIGGNGARWSEPGSSTSVIATSGLTNTGSGGGGAGDASTFVGPSQINSGAGGSGIVIIRYPVS